jgi:hypothetical protein
MKTKALKTLLQPHTGQIWMYGPTGNLFILRRLIEGDIGFGLTVENDPFLNYVVDSDFIYIGEL